jgi:hypothetical protein
MVATELRLLNRPGNLGGLDLPPKKPGRFISLLFGIQSSHFSSDKNFTREASFAFCKFRNDGIGAVGATIAAAIRPGDSMSPTSVRAGPGAPLPCMPILWHARHPESTATLLPASNSRRSLPPLCLTAGGGAIRGTPDSTGAATPKTIYYQPANNVDAQCKCCNRRPLQKSVRSTHAIYYHPL